MHEILENCEDALGLCLGLWSKSCSIGFLEHYADLQRVPVVVSQHGNMSNLVLGLRWHQNLLQSQHEFYEYCNPGTHADTVSSH